MSEVSLKELAVGRHGIIVRSIVCRCIRMGLTPDEALDAAGLADLKDSGGVLYGLPVVVAANETLFHVRLTRFAKPNQAADREDWTLTWELLSQKLAETTPASVVAESTVLGGSSGLEERVRTLWSAHPFEESFTILTVEYQLSEWKSKLLLEGHENVGQLTAAQAGSYWDISGGVLSGLSMLKKKGQPGEKTDLTLTALAKFERPSDPLDVPTLEKGVWAEIEQLMEKVT